MDYDLNPYNLAISTMDEIREEVRVLLPVLQAERAAEVIHRCRRELQGQADQLLLIDSQVSVETNHVDLTLRSV